MASKSTGLVKRKRIYSVENMDLMIHEGKSHREEGDFAPASTRGKGAKKQLTVKLDEELHRRLKTYASQNGTTITELISAYIREL